MSRPLPSALAPWLVALVCPLCEQGLEDAGGGLRCPSRHRFDLARAGYVSLLSGTPATSGDDDDMARARDRFLATGAYAPIRAAITQLAGADTSRPAVRVLDVGCGTGYYLAGLLDRLDHARGLGVDSSGRALRFAARAHQRAAAASWDVFTRFPLREGSVDLVLDVFAPRNAPEFARVLAPGGRLLVVRPARDHLAQLREAVPGMVSVDPHKEERLHRALDPLFTTEEVRHLRFPVELDADAAADLVAMTPSARHVESGALERVLSGARQVTAAVTLSVHRRR